MIKNQAPKTISKKLSAIRSFSEFLKQKGFNVILKSDDSLKVPKKLPKPISYEHIKEVIQNAEFDEKIIIVLLYSLGLRISELYNLKLEDIDESWVRVLGKRDKQRDIPLLKVAKELIDEYIKKYHPKTYLFEKKGERLSENRLRYLVNKAFARKGLKVTPHQLRHSFATSLLNNGAMIADISELLGHSSMMATEVYTKLGSSIKQKNYKKAHPLCSGDL
jgi:integrase/recombinase XerC